MQKNLRMAFSHRHKSDGVAVWAMRLVEDKSLLPPGEGEWNKPTEYEKTLNGYLICNYSASVQKGGGLLPLLMERAGVRRIQ
jgi:hypothetical protein